MDTYRRLDTHFAPKKYRALDAWEERTRWLARHVAVSLALEPVPPRPELRAEGFGMWVGDGYTCEKVFFESLPGFYVTGNLLRPEGGSAKKKPAILCPHGHWADGRLHDRDPRGSVIARCIQFARMGGIAFSYDMVGYNDSCQQPHREFAAQDDLWGLSLMALQTWNSVRSFDFLTELPDVDASRIGVTGASGGGTQTFALTAVDSRVSVSAPICMISYRMQGGCICENAPLLRIDATNVEIASLFAPKPMFIGSCSKDWTKNTAEEEFPAIGNIYEMYGAAGDLMHHHIDFEHNYNREMREHVYGFLNRHLLGQPSSEPMAELEANVPPHRDRMVWWGRAAPEALSPEAMKRLWRIHAENALRSHLKTAESARTSLGALLPHSVGVTPTSIAEYVSMSTPGIEASREGPELSIRPAKTLAYPDEQIAYYSTYNRTPFADRVHEILGVLENAEAGVNLVGHGDAGPASLVAAALSDKTAEVDVDMSGFDDRSDEDWRMYMDTPAIRQIGGLATVFSLIGERPLTLRNASDSVLELKTRYARR